MFSSNLQAYGGHTTVSVTASAAPGIVAFGSNPERKSIFIFNDSPVSAYVSFAAKRSGSIDTVNYMTQIAPMSLYTDDVRPLPTGSILMVWGTATGSAKITEMF